MPGVPVFRLHRPPALYSIVSMDKFWRQPMDHKQPKHQGQPDRQSPEREAEAFGPPRSGYDAMKGFRPGPGNTGSMTGRDETGHRQVGHEI